MNRLLEACGTLFFWGTEPSAYHLPVSCSVQAPFNYRTAVAGVPSSHTTLRLSSNDEKSAEDIWAFVHVCNVDFVSGFSHCLTKSQDRF